MYYPYVKRYLLLYLLLIGGFVYGETPDWVIFLQQGNPGRIGGIDYYSGIGESRKSQNEADRNARVDFARNVETRVVSSMEETYSQNEAGEDLMVNMSTEVTSDLSLKGVSISQRFRDPGNGVYYALILIKRDEYNHILKQNLEEELIEQEAALERSRLEMEEQSQKKEADLREREQKLADDRMKQEEKLQRKALREERRKEQMELYADYLEEREAYPRLISFDNGEIFPRRHLLSGSFGIDGSSLLRSLEYKANFAELFQLGVEGIFDTENGLAADSLTYSGAEAKLALLNDNGKVIKVSAAIGAKGFVSYPLDSGSRSDPQGTLFGAVNVSLPQLLYNDISLYAGLDKVALGTAWYPSFNLLGDVLGILAESSYVYNKDLQNVLQPDPLTFQLGLQFRPVDFLCGRLSWEDNFHSFVLSVDVNW